VGDYTWTVKATGAANATLVQVSGDDANFRFYYSKGLAVDNSFDSPFFGRIYVAESFGSGDDGEDGDYWENGNGRITESGIYVFDPLHNAINDEAYKGNIPWGTTDFDVSAGAGSPWKLAVDDAGKVFIADNSIANSGVYIMDPTDPTTFTTVFDDAARDNASGIVEGIHGRISGIYVEGSGDNTVLYTVDRNYLPDGFAARAYLPSGMVFKYEIGDLKAPYSKEPALIYDNTGSRIANEHLSLIPDGLGGLWVYQNRSADMAAIPSLMHIPSGSDTYDYVSTDQGLFTGVENNASGRGAIAINKEGDRIALGSDRKVKLYSVAYDPDTDIPALTLITESAIIGTNIDGMAFDAAGNIYTCSASTEWLYQFAPPKADNTFTTPAPVSQPVSVTKEIGEIDGIAGDYYIPNDPGNGKKWFATLKEAFDAINEDGIAGNVRLLINDDIESADNVGLVNDTEYSITIIPDGNLTPVITFTNTSDNAGPSGTFIMGCGSGLAWADIAPAKNIILDGLTIQTAPTALAGGFPLVIIDACENITIKNCVIKHQPAGSYTLYLRCNPNQPGQKVMPKNVIIENSEIINLSGSASGQAIAIYADAAPLELATGIVIKDNIIRARTRDIFLNYVDGIEIIGNEFHIDQTAGGMMSAGIFSNVGIEGIINVVGNKFIEMKSANTTAGDYGIKAIVTGGATSTWYIDNNYFTGFDKTSATASTTMMQAIRLGALAGSYIRHNTFFMNELTNKPTNDINPGAANPSYCAINIAIGTPIIQNNLFVSAEDAFPNFFIRSDAAENVENVENNVFSLPENAANAVVATGSDLPGVLKMVDKVEFADAVAGNLDLTGASNKDNNLGVPFLADVLYDIYGTLRNTELTYAGAYEADPLFVGLNAINTDDVRIACNGNQITVTSLSGNTIQSIKLYDLQGRTIVSKQGISANVYLITAPSRGIYIIETLITGSRNTQKVIVR
jgi:hypothetical protein